MVRRWSFVNKVNLFYTWNFTFWRQASGEFIFKETTNFRKTTRPIAYIRRKGWGRRKHNTHWVSYQNILADWAHEYRFLVQYSNYLLTRSLFQHSFFTYNTLTFQTSRAGFRGGWEHFNHAALTFKLLRYLGRSTVWYLQMRLLFANSPLLACSTRFCDDTATKLIPSLTFSSFHRLQSSLSSSLPPVESANALSFVLKAIHDLLIIIALESYKVFTLKLLTLTVNLPK